MESARSMMHYMHVDRAWWGEAEMTAAHVTNRVPNSARPRKSPLEILTSSKPDPLHLRVFGPRGFTHVDKSNVHVGK
ncbi:hypothetical protein PybrP1_006262 [[Pythium] brassicae (nom. inval.)]|nr:hypothetical protein PybrP1_006262 [[Pythium] brassicae (nom. inval.)]